VGGGFGGATVELVDHGVPFGSVRADHQSVIVTACRSQRIIADHSGTDSQTRYSDESCNELHRRHQGAARDDWGTVSCACFSFFLYFFSLRTADWGKGDSGGPQQVVHSTRTGFGFSFVLHRPFRPSSSVDLKQNKTIDFVYFIIRYEARRISPRRPQRIRMNRPRVTATANRTHINKQPRQLFASS
jgi:hypothetical protein